MKARIFQVDAFTTRRFAGNPAAVVLMPEFPEDPVMQAIAAENNLAETAFLVPANGDYRLRWFTPTNEIELCGHATLASAAVLMERMEPARTRVVFHSPSGPLTVVKVAGGYNMDFPALSLKTVSPPTGLVDALGVVPLEVGASGASYVALLDSAATVRALAPDLARVASLVKALMVVTARGDEKYDFISRCFVPAQGIPEDPVTGSAHCMLTPYWAAKMGKSEFRAYQASPRGGEMMCRLKGDRVEMEGSCVFYLEGEMQY